MLGSYLCGTVITVLPGDASNIHLNLVWFPHTLRNKRELLVKETVVHVVCVWLQFTLERINCMST